MKVELINGGGITGMLIGIAAGGGRGAAGRSDATAAAAVAAAEAAMPPKGVVGILKSVK